MKVSFESGKETAHLPTPSNKPRLVPPRKTGLVVRSASCVFFRGLRPIVAKFKAPWHAQRQRNDGDVLMFTLAENCEPASNEASAGRPSSAHARFDSLPVTPCVSRVGETQLGWQELKGTTTAWSLELGPISGIRKKRGGLADSMKGMAGPKPSSKPSTPRSREQGASTGVFQTSGSQLGT